ncbi:MAG: di-trans,poly-cis-decaprenylcistransferase, partial [Clostridia bacterium]|nr:di-trans,poly-cis-decaprenylcistransferase [Clostridia bacterium]
MTRKFTDEQLAKIGLSPELPKHVAIIMDGNGRWANSRGLPRTFGHRAGVERLHGIIKNSSDLGIEALSLYAFSTENWKRPKAEVSALSALFIEYFKKEINELHENN